ncbi:MAG: ABC transporter permease [Chloroflexi bacterium SZAS-1]|jgi:simple sugar transport system permease protein|nr:ABC transporter permease [Chloroflexi bacterium SZAS-1]HNP87248.1 ABC transporter permease [Kouleothrix sp.]
MNAQTVRKLGRAALLPLLSIFTALLVGGVIIWLSGPKFNGDWFGIKFVLDGYGGLFLGAFGTQKAIIGTLVRATPYIFAGLAVALAFRCGLFNIGAEGQLTMGALLAAGVGFGVKGMPLIIHLPLTLLAGMLGGFVWGMIPGFLKARTGAHEVITTIMLNYIAAQISGYLLNGPWKDPTNVTAQTPKIAESARLPALLPGLHWGVVLAFLAAIAVWYFLWKTTWGFEIRTVGANSSAAKYAGINVSRNIVLAMGLSGLLAGLAGAVQVAGVNYRSTLGFNVGYGFDSIAIALLGRNTALGVVLSSLLFGGLRNGATIMQFRTQISSDIISVIQALILIFVAAEQIIRWIYRVPATPDDAGQATLSKGWGKS